MNYSELTTTLAKSFANLSDSDLRGLNSFLVSEINDRIRQKRDSLRSTLRIGDRVTVDHPQCRGKFYIIEKFTAKSAVVRQDTQNPAAPSFSQPKLRASINLLKLS